MITIFDFSLHKFRTVSIKAAKVSDLINAARKHAPNLFVFHDPESKFAALVIPEMVIEVAERLLGAKKLKRNSLAIEAGLLDLLKQGQITVRENQPAQVVAELVALYKIQVVIVIDHNQSPIGLFIPSVVMRRLKGSKPYREGSPRLRQEIDKYVQKEDLIGAIEAIESEFKTVHSESFNIYPSDPYVCSSSVGRHVVTKCPCKKHKRDPMAVCGARNVAQ